MKNLILTGFLTLLCANVSAQTKQFTVDRMSILPDFTQSFLLTNSKPNSYYGILDCQSFFQKLDFYDLDGLLITENFITINECIQFYEVTARCIEKNNTKCFDMSDIFSPNCNCN